MATVIKLGMMFDSETAPDFGGICQTRSGDFTCPADDITKLNTVFTRSACSALMTGGNFPVCSGDVAFIPDWKFEETAKVYMYDEASDAWYEVVSNDDED